MYARNEIKYVWKYQKISDIVKNVTVHCQRAVTTLGGKVLSPLLILPAVSTDCGRRTLYFNLSLLRKRDALFYVHVQIFTWLCQLKVLWGRLDAWQPLVTMYCLLSWFYLLFQLTMEDFVFQSFSCDEKRCTNLCSYSDMNLIMPVKSAVGKAGCLTTPGYNILSPFLISPAISTNYGRRTLYFNLSLVMKRDAPLCVHIKIFTWLCELKVLWGRLDPWQPVVIIYGLLSWFHLLFQLTMEGGLCISTFLLWWKEMHYFVFIFRY